jgi:hypothetical protein
MLSQYNTLKPAQVVTCNKRSLFSCRNSKFQMNWTSIKRSPVLKVTFSLSQRWSLNTILLTVQSEVNHMLNTLNCHFHMTQLRLCCGTGLTALKLLSTTFELVLDKTSNQNNISNTYSVLIYGYEYETCPQIKVYDREKIIWFFLSFTLQSVTKTFHKIAQAAFSLVELKFTCT